MARWVMVIDLRKCIGCQTCFFACEQFNNMPGDVRWRKVLEFETPRHSKGERIFLPMNCMHCKNPPCLAVCPSKATYCRPDGIIDINHRLCIGCGYCVLACPYEARAISSEDKLQIELGGNLKQGSLNPPDRMGICTKCNFCLEKVDVGVSKGLKPGLDPEATPNCVTFCMAKALFFGDLDDTESEVSKLIRENETVCLQEDLGTDPSIYYIP